MAEKVRLEFEFGKSTMIFVVVALLVGYSIGNLFPYGASSGPTVSPGSSTPPTSTGKVELSIDGDPVIGNANAPIQMFEFSDFQCPFCRRFYVQTLPQLEDEYLKTGKVAFIYKDFPLDQIHPGAVPAAMAAQCANDQGKWREFHNKVYDEQNEQGTGTIEFSVSDLKTWASEISLDTATFNQCLDSQKYLQEVQGDFQEGVNAGVSGTPTFYIGNIDKGFIAITGAQPYSVLKQAIDQQLA